LKHIPNIISLLRMLLVVPIGWLILKESWGLAFILIFIAGFSDALDGYLARVYHWQSELGSILDPVADKLLLVVLFITLTLKGLIPEWLTILVVFRDLIILIGALCYQWLTKALKIKPLLSSKINTALQIIFILMLMAHIVITPLPESILHITQFLVALTTLYSGIAYVVGWTHYYKEYLSSTKEEQE